MQSYTNDQSFIKAVVPNPPVRKLAKSAKKGPAHWRRRPEARREEILDAALAVFAEKGFYAAHMKEIGARAGVSQGTAYLYFTSKEEIFKSLVEESIGPQILQLTQMAREFNGPTLDLLRLVIRTLAVFLRSSNRAVLPKLILAETGNFPALARFYRDEVTNRMLDMFEGFVRRGIARGEFREINPKHGAQLIITPITFIAIWRTSFGRLDSEPYDFEGFIETHLEIICRGFAADAKPESAHLLEEPARDISSVFAWHQ